MSGSERRRNSSPRAQGLAGRRIGHYRLVEELGHGGQGFVYLAEDERIRRHVALKILPQGLLLSPSARLRFEREAEAAGKLDHPGIARLYDYGEADGILYIAMEYVKGRTLASQISSTRMRSESGESLAEVHIDFDEGDDRSAEEHDAVRSADHEAIHRATRLVESAARALHAAHEAGLLHRDIKPGNLMVREDGTACLLDFGLARDEESDKNTVTRSGDIVGTPSYMSPEQLLAHRLGIDRRSDIFSLGVTLFEACTLRCPFEGRTRHEIYRAIVQKEPPPPRRLNPRIPKDLEAIILTAIDKDRDRRYKTALEFAEDLRRFRSYEPVVARPAGAFVRGWRWVQRNPLVAALLAIVFAALATASVVFYVKGDQARRALSDRERALASERTERRAKERALAERGEALANYDRLADVKRLEAAVAGADRLHPPGPELVPLLEAWLEEHRPLAGRLEGHRARLAELRASAAGPAGPAGHRFVDQKLQFQHDVLTELVRDLEDFALSAAGTLRQVERRLEQSRRIVGATITEQGPAWRDCRERVRADPRYDGLDLAPRPGLVPLGPDPGSGLEEFLHWLTHEGPVPRRDATGRLEVTESLGIVLVLVPGGRFRMGSQAEDPGAPNHDPRSLPDERPVHEIRLRPYFLAKHEMTQGQWRRAFAFDPSRFGPATTDVPGAGPIDLRHPVEQVSWEDARRLLPRVGLELPTEAEWERAARADGNSVYPGAATIAALRRVANLSGAETRAAEFASQQEGHEDPWVIHAPVGSLGANDFGFHDMAGNVWEWCLDGFQRYDVEGDDRGLRGDPASSSYRMGRGGCFDNTAVYLRVANRSSFAPGFRFYVVGLRPALSLGP